VQDIAFILVFSHLPRSTGPGHSFVGRHNEYQTKGGDALQLGSKGRRFIRGWQVKLWDPLGPYKSASDM